MTTLPRFAGKDLRALAERHGTPLYLYDADGIRAGFRTLREATGATLAFSVKANRHEPLLRLLAAEGAHFDVVSGGELDIVAGIGVAGERIVFAGVGKRADEIRRGIELGIAQFNVESAGEARRIARIAGETGRPARIALRVTPNVDASTHHYITTGTEDTKFGLPPGDARMLLGELRGHRHVRIVGLHAHIGSQITDPAVFGRAASAMEAIARDLGEGAAFANINLGGGFGIDYRGTGEVPAAATLARPLAEAAARLGLPLILEPGRCIVGPHGILLTRVEYVKRTARGLFAIVDAAMTDLMRPALYGAFHRIVPVAPHADAPPVRVDVVGPVCESSDFLGRDRIMPEPREGDLLAVLDAGAYGASMASTYNARALPKELLLD